MIESADYRRHPEDLAIEHGTTIYREEAVWGLDEQAAAMDAGAAEKMARESDGSKAFDDIDQMVAEILAPEPLPPDVREAIDLAEAIIDMVGDLPSEGQDFGDSVAEKAESIAANVRRHRRVTDGQMSALENMLSGVERWFD